MADCIWLPNPEWKNLPAPEGGDIVHLRRARGFNHLVKVIVISVNDDEITGKVDAVFDWDTGGEVRFGEVLSLVGEQFAVDRCMMHRVIKKPERME